MKNVLKKYVWHLKISVMMPADFEIKEFHQTLHRPLVVNLYVLQNILIKSTSWWWLNLMPHKIIKLLNQDADFTNIFCKNIQNISGHQDAELIIKELRALHNSLIIYEPFNLKRAAYYLYFITKFLSCNSHLIFVPWPKMIDSSYYFNNKNKQTKYICLSRLYIYF
jgi:hypothetical protein